MLPIKKEEFCDLIRLIMAQERKELQLYKGISEAIDCDLVGRFCEDLIVGIVAHLDRLCGGERFPDAKWVSWWLWDNQDPAAKRVILEEEEITLDTPEKLYDFLASI